MSRYSTVWGCHAFYLLTDFIFFFLSWTTECFCFSCWWQILLIFPPPVRMARLCIEKDPAENLNTKQEVLWFQHFVSFADSLTMNRSVSALPAFTDSLLRKGLRSLRGRESEKGGGGENLKEMLVIHSETVNSQPDPTLPKLSLVSDLTPPHLVLSHLLLCRSPPPSEILFFQPVLRKVTVFDLLYFASISPFTCPLFPPFPFLSWARLKPGGKAHWCFCRPPSRLICCFHSHTKTTPFTHRLWMPFHSWFMNADSGRVLLASPSTDIHFDAVLWLYLIFIVLYVYRGCMDLCTYCNLNSQTHIYGSY